MGDDSDGEAETTAAMMAGEEEEAPTYSFFGRGAAAGDDDDVEPSIPSPLGERIGAGVSNSNSGVQDFLPAFANSENIALSKEVRSKELTLEDTERKLGENSERVKVMSDHNRNVQEEMSFVQSRLEAKQKEVETEAHLRQLAQREMGRYQSDQKKFIAAQAAMREKLVAVQRQVWEGNEKMDQFKLLMNWNQEELEQWALASRQKEEDSLAIDKYIREDEGRISALRLELEKTTKLVGRKEQELEDEVTETRARQIMLDKTAQDFRELHEERQALLQQFEDAADAITKRDAAIREASELYATKRAELHQRQTHLDEKARFLEAECQNNKELETRIAAQERSLSRQRQDLATAADGVQEMADEVDVLKNTLGKAANDLMSTLNSNTDAREAIEGKRRRLEAAQLRLQGTEARLKGADDHLGTIQTKMEDLEALHAEEEEALSRVTKEVTELKERTYKASQDLFKGRERERDLIAVIAGTQSQIKNMSLKAAQLDAQVQKQQQLLYTAEFQIQQLERKVARASGERSDEEKRALNARIDALNVELEARASEHSLLSGQVKKANDELRTAQRVSSASRHECAMLQNKMSELQLESENAGRSLKTSVKEREDTQVNHDLLRLEVKKLRDVLSLRSDEVFSLENRKFQLEMSLEERKQEVLVYQEKLRASVKALNDDIHRCSLELNERSQKLQRLSNKYDIMVGRVRSNEEGEEGDAKGGDAKSQTYYMIKAAQEREELQREGDTLDSNIRKAEKEVRALEVTLAKVNLNNTSYRGSFRAGGTNAQNQALAQMKELREKLDRAYDRMKIARGEERGLQDDVEQGAVRVEGMESEMGSVQALVTDFEDRAGNITREIEENKERLKAATRQWNKIHADTNARNPEAAVVVDMLNFEPVDAQAAAGANVSTVTIEGLDVMAYQQKELFREAMGELRKMGEMYPELNIPEKVAQAGFKLTSGATSGYMSGGSSRASSRAPSEAGR